MEHLPKWLRLWHSTQRQLSNIAVSQDLAFRPYEDNLASMWVESVILLLAFSVVVPAIAVAIGYAAWTGKPKNWDRSTYWTAFIASIVASGFLMVYAQQMQSDVRTPRYVLQVLLFGFGVLMFGVAGGCMVGIFAYRHGKGPIWREVTSRPGNSADNVETENRSDN